MTLAPREAPLTRMPAARRALIEALAQLLLADLARHPPEGPSSTAATPSRDPDAPAP
jgi:hypothetical protein